MSGHISLNRLNTNGDILVYHKSISTLLQMMSFLQYIRSHVATNSDHLRMKTLDWSVETLGRECNSP